MPHSSEKETEISSDDTITNTNNAPFLAFVTLLTVRFISAFMNLNLSVRFKSMRNDVPLPIAFCVVMDVVISGV